MNNTRKRKDKKKIAPEDEVAVGKKKQDSPKKSKTMDVSLGEDGLNTRHSITNRVLSRIVLVAGVMIMVWFGNKGTVSTLASQKQRLALMRQNLTCSEDYKEDKILFKDCVPINCGRVVTDELVTDAEVFSLLQIAMKGLHYGGSNGGASILDLHSGALSKGDSFINIYKQYGDIFSEQDYAMYKSVKNKIHKKISETFSIQPSKLYLTHPTFFSRMTNTSAKTVHDEYWHPHVDKETYQSFYYTSLLYLADYNIDFQGGRFVFVDSKEHVNRTVEPRKGRVSFFTSGSENLHYVEKVASGTRYAITVSFTCNKKFAIKDISKRN